MKPSVTTSIIMKTLTWSRDSHGLFDYESRQVNKQYLTCKGSVHISRHANSVELSSSVKNSCDEDFRQLAYLEESEQNYFLKPRESENLWLVVRSIRGDNIPSGFVIGEGDVIKLGRVKYRVAELKGLDEPKTAESLETTSDSSPEEEEVDSEITCKVCLYGGSSKENPLITPCYCSGTMKYIHLGCLRGWIKSGLSVMQTENSTSYFWKTAECEICKYALPMKFHAHGKPFDLFYIEKPNVPYIILEGIARERSNNRGIHVIMLTNKCTVKLGRGHDSDVRISDISVSRCHAIIKYTDGQFVLEDNNSKFGTLIQVQDKFEIQPDSSVAVQIGRTVISLCAKSETPISEEDMDLEQ